MRLKVFKNTVLLFVLIGISCASKTNNNLVDNDEILNQVQDDNKLLSESELVVGANQIQEYLPLLKGKRIGIVANQSSIIFKEEGFTHIVDSLLSLHITIDKVFSPEHGFRGKADAGEVVKDGLDPKTGLPIVSLYSANKKPKLEQIKETEKYEKDIDSGITAIDIMVFDLQDVGARFYTYISTLHYVMEACAEANIPLIILDRPNPNGHYVDGPILEMEHQSFVGMHPIPVVHGMTIGEYAKMINGEGWLANNIKCDITVIPMKNYTHQTAYSLPIKPSPNLPNDKAINLYPSLCFFEGTTVSAGRGTSKQFQIYGSPYLRKNVYNFKFLPSPNEGAKHPKHEKILCYGEDLSNTDRLSSINLEYLIKAYHNTLEKEKFFNAFFTKLAGTKQLQLQIEQGLSASEIRKSWQSGLDHYDTMRTEYLIYK
ncbi:hypothetical protein A9Q87_13720 [Flavobacteriales bacterium 34_180_T64]|nr:hypothetical protein A9Q87_13720 [Flavobacteriales bacterium 34_180_T64]